MAVRTKTAGRGASRAVRALRGVFALCVLTYLCYQSFFGGPESLQKAYRLWLYAYVAFGACWLLLSAVRKVLPNTKHEDRLPQKPDSGDNGADEP